MKTRKDIGNLLRIEGEYITWDTERNDKDNVMFFLDILIRFCSLFYLDMAPRHSAKPLFTGSNPVAAFSNFKGLVPFLAGLSPFVLWAGFKAPNGYLKINQIALLCWNRW